MKNFSLIAASAFAVLAFTGSAAHAQKTTQLGMGDGGSAHVRTDWMMSGANISITYGRPSLKGRSEAQMMPVGTPWRTGADVASILKTDKALKFGTVTVQPGSYTINTQPGDASWAFILGKLATPNQWGIPYQSNLEIGRAPMKLAKTAAPVEMVTFVMEPAKDGGTLKVQWGTKSAELPFSVVK